MCGCVGVHDFSILCRSPHLGSPLGSALCLAAAFVHGPAEPGGEVGGESRRFIDTPSIFGDIVR